MKLQLRPFTNQEFFDQVWTEKFSESIREIGDIPQEILSQLKEINGVALYTLQIKQHQDATVALLERVSNQLALVQQDGWQKTIEKELTRHLKIFVDQLVQQCQNNLLNYMKMKYGPREEVTTDKASTITTDNIKSFLAKNTVAVLDFWAPWCGPCMSVAPVINQLVDFYQNRVGIGKVNVDENSVLAKEYKVASIPTLLLIKNGRVTKTLVGFQSLEVLRKHIDELLAAKVS